MTTPAVPAETAQQPEQREKYYVIDPQWYELRGLSLEHLVHARLCQECRQKPPEAERKGKKEKGSTVVEVPAWLKHVETIATCCSAKAEYIRPDTPLLEAVFRLLLAGRNKPQTVASLGEALRQRWPTSEMPREVPLLQFQRILERQSFYGIVEAKPLQQEGASAG